MKKIIFFVILAVLVSGGAFAYRNGEITFDIFKSKEILIEQVENIRDMQ